MASSTIPDFESTSMERIPNIASLIRTTFATQKTKPISYRLTQLRKLYWALADNSDAIVEACKLDLGKSSFETYVTEVDWVKSDILFVIKNLEKWAADEPAPDIPLANKFLSPRIRKDPIGHVLIIGCWNFAFQLTLGPFIGAIAAGCTAVVKPSEASPHAAMLIKRIIETSLDSDSYAVVNGGVPETTALLNEKWDKIFYTGNAKVGTIIAKKAAETLTPVALELGGRNPAIVTASADVRLVARRLLWGKLLNAGQVCMGQNYILVDETIVPSLVSELRAAIAEFFPNGTKASPDFARIVNTHHFERIKAMLDHTEGKILIGGETDASQKFIDITVVQVKSPEDSLIKDESFGPIITILPVKDLAEAIRIANTVHRTPLGLYAFGTKAETNRILSEVTSGGASVNDAYFHGSIPTLAFGGVGDSGQGSYRGKASFDCFTHMRSVTNTPGWMEKLLEVRYPPYTSGKMKRIRATGGGLKPDFDRNGKQIRGLRYWVSFLFSLGGEGAKSSILRWAFVIALAYGAKSWANRNGLPGYLR